MPYDPSLDQCLFSKTMENDDQKLTVSVYSYNGGAKKLQIARETKNAQGEFRFAKMGRLSKDEINGILPFIQEAQGLM